MFNFDFWLLQTLAMLLTAILIPGLKISGPFSALLTVIVLAFINANIWDAALFFEIPNTFTFHALLLIVVNGVLFWIVAKLLPGIDIEGVLPAIAAPIVFTLCSLIIATWGKDIDWNAVWQQMEEFIEHLKRILNDSPAPSVSSAIPDSVKH